MQVNESSISNITIVRRWAINLSLAGLQYTFQQNSYFELRTLRVGLAGTLTVGLFVGF
jgi:hypothetical protein